MNANAQEARHFLVATGFTANGRVIAIDPSDGKTKYYTQEEWMSAWGTQEYRGMTLTDASAPNPTDNGGLPNALGLLLALFTAGAVAPALAMAREYLRLGIGVGGTEDDGGGGDWSPPADPPADPPTCNPGELFGGLFLIIAIELTLGLAAFGAIWASRGNHEVVALIERIEGPLVIGGFAAGFKIMIDSGCTDWR